MRKFNTFRWYFYPIAGVFVALRVGSLFFYQYCDTPRQLALYDFIQKYYIDGIFIFFGIILFLDLLWLFLSRVFKSQVSVVILIVLISLFLMLSILMASLNTARVRSKDAKRIADLSQIQLALELWADGNATSADPIGYYPPNLLTLAPKYISSVPTDPSGEEYDYHRSEDWKSYILRAFLIQNEDHVNCETRSLITRNPVLEHDLDGTILGIDCNDPAYCVSNQNNY